MNRKYVSLKIQSVLVILLAALVAFAVFFLLYVFSSNLLDSYFADSDYNERQAKRYLAKLRQYVSERQIEATDINSLEEWIDRRKLIYLSIGVYRDGETIYESVYGFREIQEDENFMETDIVGSEIQFADGPAYVYLMGYFDNQFHMAAIILEIMAATIVFLIIYSAFFRSRINYVISLEREIRILETGGLEHPITIKGNDEIASLAEGLEQMRISLYENIVREEEAVKANYDLVMRVAHDLRTPLTALILYLNLLHGKKYNGDEQLEKYVEKSLLKSEQIKSMSDRLFERFLVSGEETLKLEPPKKIQYVFEDILSDMMVFLEGSQFIVEGKIEWPDTKISVVTDYVGRIVNNISSNLIKYADNETPVVLYLHQEKRCLILGVRNKIRVLEEKQESTQVGIQNMMLMMQKMGGRLEVERENGFFEVRLIFKTV